MVHLHFTLLASTPVCLRGCLVRRSPAGWRRKTLQTEPLEITLQNPKSNQSNLKNGLFYLEQSITTWNGMKVFVFLIYLLFYIQLKEKKGKNTPFR